MVVVSVMGRLLTLDVPVFVSSLTLDAFPSPSVADLTLQNAGLQLEWSPTISQIVPQLADVSGWCMHSDGSSATCSKTPYGLLSEFAGSLEMWSVFDNCF